MIDGIGWTAGMVPENSFRVAMLNAPNGVVLISDDGNVWSSPDKVQIGERLCTASFHRVEGNCPRLTLTSVEGKTYQGYPDCGGDDYVQYGFSLDDFFPSGAPHPGSLHARTFRVPVAWVGNRK